MWPFEDRKRAGKLFKTVITGRNRTRGYKSGEFFSVYILFSSNCSLICNMIKDSSEQYKIGVLTFYGPFHLHFINKP